MIALNLNHGRTKLSKKWEEIDKKVEREHSKIARAFGRDDISAEDKEYLDQLASMEGAFERANMFAGHRDIHSASEELSIAENYLDRACEAYVKPDMILSPLNQIRIDSARQCEIR